MTARRFTRILLWAYIELKERPALRSDLYKRICVKKWLNKQNMQFWKPLLVLGGAVFILTAVYSMACFLNWYNYQSVACLMTKN